MLNKVLPLLDKVAESLESKGLIKEASEIDVISNTIEKMSDYKGSQSKVLSILRGKTDSAWEAFNALAHVNQSIGKIKIHMLSVGHEDTKDILKGLTDFSTKWGSDGVETSIDSALKMLNKFLITWGDLTLIGKEAMSYDPRDPSNPISSLYEGVNEALKLSGYDKNTKANTLNTSLVSIFKDLTGTLRENFNKLSESYGSQVEPFIDEEERLVHLFESINLKSLKEAISSLGDSFQLWSEISIL